MNHQEALVAVLARNATYDGQLWFGVRSTRIFCRPSCPARRPRRDRIIFFSSAHAARSAGYRPCKRCHPLQQHSRTEARVAAARRLIHEAPDHRITLHQLALCLRCDPRHLHRSFVAATGVTPFQYARALRDAEEHLSELRINKGPDEIYARNS